MSAIKWHAINCPAINCPRLTVPRLTVPRLYVRTPGRHLPVQWSDRPYLGHASISAMKYACLYIAKLLPPPHLVCASLYELRSRDMENRFESIRVAIFGFDTIADYFDFFWRWRRQIGENVAAFVCSTPYYCPPHFRELSLSATDFDVCVYFVVLTVGSCKGCWYVCIYAFCFSKSCY